MSTATCDFAMIGLAVMGENLALNVESRGYTVAVYNRTTSVTDEFLAGKAAGRRVVGCHTLEDLVRSLKRPRKIMMLVKAGPAVDALIAQLQPLLEPGDVIIDGGNTHYADTERRTAEVEAMGFLYCGSGVSGGEEGALKGPSLMPGGSPASWEIMKPIFQSIAAKVGPNNDIPCCEWVGPRGAGHYVKMVHNGIEYGDMQMICEAYDLMKNLLGMSAEECAAVFAEWNKGVLDSFLIEITADILAQKDPAGTGAFVDIVLDTAGQKGTGKWTSVNALDMGTPAPTVAEAVFARFLSAVKDERVNASKLLSGPATAFTGDRAAIIAAIHDALYCSKICAYAQGFQLMRAAQVEYKWELPFADIARIFRGGCIIRARFLQKITEAYLRNAGLVNLLLDPFFKSEIDRCQTNWRQVVAAAATNGIPAPTFFSALSYYDAYRSETLPANLLQAQRDYFGAHTYERTDQPRGKFFHLDWPEPSRPQIEV